MSKAQQPSLFVMPQAELKPAPRIPEDAPARRDAIDTTRSILVQAPAGAGKTSLLTQRFLALLAKVDEPEQILAITFTRAATAEMRHRILSALESARNAPPGGGESKELELARAALQHGDACNWQLLEQPHRLDVQTIDSLCLRLAHAQPLLARLGGALQPAENDLALYNTAARRTTALLGDQADPELAAALELLLLRRDNNLSEVERLLAEMLQNRNAWLGVLPLAGDIDWPAVRTQLEQPFLDAHQRVLTSLTAFVEAEPELLEEWFTLARYAAGNLDQSSLDGADLSILFADAPSTLDHVHWLALTALLLKKDGDPRASWDVRHGFPPPEKNLTKQEQEQRRQNKARMKDCSRSLQALVSGPDSLTLLLCQLRSLPAPGYTEDQWQTLRAAFLVLRRATAELRFVFAENNRVDFVEIAQAAEQVLRDETTLRGMLESEQRRHLLIDEFQDTSRAQYRLVAELMREWQPGDGRSIFLVGDPLQSIYSFRQAEVALFHQTRDHGLPCSPSPGQREDAKRHACHPLQLTHNFRAHKALVDTLNQRLAQVFPPENADTFVPATAWPGPRDSENSLQLHTAFINTDAGQPVTRDEETQAVVDILESEIPRIADAQARGESEYRVAVLVSARNHLAYITRALRDRRIPFRAVDLEPLAERQEVHDLHMLLRALLHPGERVAWLTVLRAPWCGLTLNDLHILAGSDDRTLLKRPVAELIQTRAALLSRDGRQRLERTWQALQHALHTRYSEDNNTSLAAWLERTWTALGGPACVDANTRENADAFFCLLDELQPTGVEVLRGDFALRLGRLCAAPDTRVSERFGIQLMTIHKAKGLGFEVVLVPGLDRKTRSGGSNLLAMLERTRSGSPFQSELLLAPIGSRETETDATYCWVQSQLQLQIEEERKRLFYVACTRARTRLHLFATFKTGKGKVAKATKGSLVAASGAAFTGEIEQRAASFLSREGDLAPAGLQLAASAELPVHTAFNVLERLPAGWNRADFQISSAMEAFSEQRLRKPLFKRNNSGSLLARARGNAVHAVLERLAHLFAVEPDTADPEQWQQILARIAERTLRAGGYSGPPLHSTAAETARTGITVATSSIGRWLLSPHIGSLAESTWQTWDEDGNLRTLRVDRSFRAGPTPAAYGDQCLWLIDYKTGGHAPDAAHADDEKLIYEWREQQKQQWRGQLEAYGAVLRQSSGQNTENLRYGLFFPELLELITWAE